MNIGGLAPCCGKEPRSGPNGVRAGRSENPVSASPDFLQDVRSEKLAPIECENPLPRETFRWTRPRESPW